MSAHARSVLVFSRARPYRFDLGESFLIATGLLQIRSGSCAQGSDHGEGEWARRLEDVEVTVEGNFVADLGLVLVDPRVGGLGKDFAVEVGFHILMQGTFSVSRRSLSGWGSPFGLALGDQDVAVCIAQGAFDGNRSVAEVLVAEDTAYGCAVLPDFDELAE